MISNVPRSLKLFHPSNNGFAEFRDIGEALEIDPSSGLPNAGEHLVVEWQEPGGTTGHKKMYAGFDIFLDNGSGGTPPNNHPISNIPDEHFISSCSMAAILAGEVHPGTKEYLTQIASDQNDNNFETILGEVKIKSVTIVDTGNQATDGNFYDIVFQRTGQGSNTKTVRADVVSISRYQNRSNSYAISACCAPGAVTREFGKKTISDLGSEGSQLRIDIINFLQDQRFYA